MTKPPMAEKKNLLTGPVEEFVARVTRGMDLVRRIQQGATILKVDVVP